MPKIVRMWCRDCVGEDPQGCFEGGTEDSAKVFETFEEAEAYGWKITSGPPWSFEVIEADA